VNFPLNVWRRFTVAVWLTLTPATPEVTVLRPSVDNISEIHLSNPYNLRHRRTGTGLCEISGIYCDLYLCIVKTDNHFLDYHYNKYNTKKLHTRMHAQIAYNYELHLARYQVIITITMTRRRRITIATNTTTTTTTNTTTTTTTSTTHVHRYRPCARIESPT